jgi:predicted nucleic acid-binding protein
MSAIRRGTLRREFSLRRGAEMFADYMSLPLRRHDHRAFLRRIFELQNNFTPYDAAYISLAERLDATLVTCDLRLTRAARQFSDLNVVGVGT